jgi:hypothetical protein
MSELFWKPKTFAAALLVITTILLILAGVTIGVYTALEVINVASVPYPFNGIVVFLKTTLLGGSVSVGFIWLRNVFGFLTAKYGAQADGVAEIYNINKFYQTASYYFGTIAIVFNMAPTAEWRIIGTAIIFFLDLLASVLAQVFPTAFKKPKPA